MNFWLCFPKGAHVGAYTEVLDPRPHQCWRQWGEKRNQDQDTQQSSYKTWVLVALSHGQRSLESCSSWGCKESDMTEQLTLSLSQDNRTGKTNCVAQWYLPITGLLDSKPKPSTYESPHSGHCIFSTGSKCLASPLFFYMTGASSTTNNSRGLSNFIASELNLFILV